MADIVFPPLGQPIVVYSAIHQKDNCNCVSVMDNLAYPDHWDYDWASMYGVFPDENSPIPAPYANHRGTDITNGQGSDIFAVIGGRVTDTGGTYNWVIIQADDGFTYRYLHNSSVLVSSGQTVTAGTRIALEGGYGPNGPNTYASHSHLDRYETATGVVWDAFNIATGSSSGKSDVYVKVENINDWDVNSDKIGLWVGGVVTVKAGAALFFDVNGSRAIINTSSGQVRNAAAWIGEFGQSMRTIVSNLVADKAQVSVYDQLGAFHPQIWVNISDINW